MTRVSQLWDLIETLGFRKDIKDIDANNDNVDNNDNDDHDDNDDNDNNNNNSKDGTDDKGISALGLNRDIGFWKGHQGHSHRRRQRQ